MSLRVTKGLKNIKKLKACDLKYNLLNLHGLLVTP
jgi:hypothetical protein